MGLPSDKKTFLYINVPLSHYKLRNSFDFNKKWYIHVIIKPLTFLPNAKLHETAIKKNTQKFDSAMTEPLLQKQIINIILLNNNISILLYILCLF